MRRVEIKPLIIRLSGIFLVFFSLLFINPIQLKKYRFIPVRDYGEKDIYLMSFVNFIKYSLIIIGLIIFFTNEILPFIKKTFFKIDNKFNKNRDIKYMLILLIILLSFFFVFGVSKNVINMIEFEESAKTPSIYAYNIYRTLILYKNIMYNFLTIQDIDRAEIDIPIYDVFIRQNKLEQLNEDLPWSGRTYVTGTLISDNIQYPANFRYRGMVHDNWYFPKKSWKIKLRNKQIHNTSNKLNLLVNSHPPFQRLYLSYNIAKKLGIMAPEVQHVTVFLNNAYSGVYSSVEQLDETYLRNKFLLPGDIFYGDSIQDEENKSMSYNQWEIQTTYDGNSSRARDFINYFDRKINSNDSAEFLKFYNKHLGDDYLKWVAYNIAIANSHNVDYGNVRLYFNPASGRFVPIVWDPNFYLSPKLPINIINMKTYDQIHKYPWLVEQKNKYIYYFLHKDLSEENINSITEEIKTKIEYEAKHDRNKILDIAPWIITNKEYENSFDVLEGKIFLRNSYLREKLNDNRINAYLIDQKFLVFDVGGESGTKIDISLFLNDTTKRNFNIYRIGNLNQNNKSRHVKLFVKEQFNFTLGVLLPGRKYAKNFSMGQGPVATFDSSYLRYVFEIEQDQGVPFDINVLSVNSITGKTSVVTPKPLKSIDDLPVLEKSVSLHPWDIKIAQPENITLKGNILINESIIIQAGEILKIESGTVVRLTTNTSIFSYGKIRAEGTEDEPIIFQKASSEPWGSIILQGEDAEGVFDHVIFEGGSGAHHELSKYSGMVSAYAAKSIFINNSIFRTNYYYDDLFNAKETPSTIINSQFIDAYGDAIDFDKSPGIIKDNMFFNVSNDAIDISISNVTIENNYIFNAGDKGISVGEASEPYITGNTIENSNVGIAVKDSSEAIIVENDFIKNYIAIAAYHKIWRYPEGGKAYLLNNMFVSNKINYVKDDPMLIEDSIGGNSSEIIYLKK